MAGEMSLHWLLARDTKTLWIIILFCGQLLITLLQTETYSETLFLKTLILSNSANSILSRMKTLDPHIFTYSFAPIIGSPM